MSSYGYQRRGNYLYDGGNRMQHQQFYYPPSKPDFDYRRRPRTPSATVLNRKFKKTTIQLDEDRVLLIYVQGQRGKRHSLVFAECEGSFDNKIQDVSIPETLVVPWIQQLHKLSKWRPGTTGVPPTSQGLINDKRVYKIDIVSMTRPELQLDSPEHAIKMFVESRSKDPANREVLSAVHIPLRSNYLVKVKEALDELLVNQSPLYHTETLMAKDGNKLYMDLIRENSTYNPHNHYLKLSHVTREFRSIIHIDAEDMESLKSMLEACIKAKKQQDDDAPKRSRKKSSKSRRRGTKKVEENKENASCSDSGEDSATVEQKVVDQDDKTTSEDAAVLIEEAAPASEVSAVPTTEQ